jgi:ABC-type glycerol-3-phosphate transport system substrate-binding protein
MKTILSKTATIGRIAGTVALCALSLAARSPDARAETTLTLWGYLDPHAKDERSQAMAHIIKTFEDANPGVTVKPTVIRWQDLSPALMRAAQSGETPDLTMVYSPTLPEHIDAGGLRPLDGELKTWSEADRGDLINLPAAKGEDGHIYGIPWELRAFGFYYRKDLLEKAHLPVPRSLSEFATTAQKVSSEGVAGVAISFNPSLSVQSLEWLVPTLVGMGARVINPDGSAAFDSPQAEKLFSYLHDLVKAGAMPLDLALTGTDQIQQAAQGGKVAFFVEGTHRFSTVRDNSVKGAEWRFLPNPSFEPGQPSPAMLEGWMLVVPTKAKHPDIAWKFLTHWTSYDMQIYQMIHSGTMPVRKKAVSDPALDAPKAEHIKVALEYSAKYPIDFHWPKTAAALNEALGRAVQQVLTDKASPKDALRAAEKNYQDLTR